MRVLLSVGCDDYSHATKLNGAVRDAESVFSALVGDQEHQYDSANSKVLISPSAEEFRKTLSDILYSKPSVTVFTLFFAGHAAVFDETLYLALKDALPDRISDIFGQCALFYFSQENISITDLNLIRDVTLAILGRYGNAVLALTDDQATGYLLFLEMCRRNQWTEFSEEVVGRLYHDLHKNFARCGAYSLNAEKRFALLAQRYRDSLSITRDLYNLPSDLATVILSFSALGYLDEAIDFSLIEIDHTSINYFVPDRFTQFGLTDGIEGSNYTLTLGRDFFRCIDLRRILRSEILPKFYDSACATSAEENFCSLASALALRDRLPWQIVDRDGRTTDG
jgi:hypothetical protein